MTRTQPTITSTPSSPTRPVQLTQITQIAPTDSPLTRAAEALARATQRAEGARARALAERHHLINRTRYHGARRGCHCFTAPSLTAPGNYHIVRYDPITDVWRCTCTAGSYGKACGHLGAAQLHWEQIQEATRPRTPEELHRDQAHDDFWQLVEDDQW